MRWYDKIHFVRTESRRAYAYLWPEPQTVLNSSTQSALAPSGFPAKEVKTNAAAGEQMAWGQECWQLRGSACLTISHQCKVQRPHGF